ncbi:MAG: hypothetical protein JWP01_1329 [Myxococcales bacterium]|nr:hypothetical protein [Myxococcales bacterium]
MKHRWIFVVLALLAATAFAMSVQGGRWWSIDDVTIGPYGAKHCFGGECKNAGLAWIGGSERWMRTGMGTWAGGLLSALMLLVVAAGLAAKRIPKLAAKTTIVAIATTVIAGIAFIAQFPGVEGAGLDRGLYLFIGGTIAGLATAVSVMRAVKPPVP